MSRESPEFPQPVTGMTPLSQLTRRNYLIAAHDALATAFALVNLLVDLTYRLLNPRIRLA